MSDVAPIVVVAGNAELSSELRRSTDLAQVHFADSVANMLRLVMGELQGARPDGIVFVISEDLPQGDGEVPLDTFLAKVCGAGYRPILLPVSGGRSSLAQRHPQCAEVNGTLTANTVLGAIAGLGHGRVQPLPDGNRPLTPSEQSFPVPDQAVAPVKEQTGGWAVPEEASWSIPQGGAVGAPSPQPAVPTPSAGNPAWAPTPDPQPVAWEAPQSGGQGWAPPSPTPYETQPAPTAVAAPTPAWSPHGTAQPPVGGSEGSYAAPVVRKSLSALGATPAAPTAPAGAWPQAGHTGEQQSWAPPAAFSPRQDAAAPAQFSRRGYVVTIAVSKGGTGKSSLTLNLAAFLGMRLRSQGKTVCVIDANIQQPDAGKYLNTYVPNVNDIANDPTILMDADPQRLLRNLIHKPEYNLSVLLGPATPDEGSPLSINAELYNRILERLRPHYDYILIDTPVAEKFHSLFAAFALPRANFIVVPVAPNLATLQNADNWLQAAVVAPPHLGGAGVDPARVGVVLNRAEEGIGLSPMDAQAEMGRWQFLGAIPETKEWKAANNRNELIAPKNYVELNQAFAQVLYHATGEQVLLAAIESPGVSRSKGFLAKLKRGRGA